MWGFRFVTVTLCYVFIWMRYTLFQKKKIWTVLFTNDLGK